VADIGRVSAYRRRETVGWRLKKLRELANIIHPLNEFRRAYLDNEEILLLLEIARRAIKTFRR